MMKKSENSTAGIASSVLNRCITRAAATALALAFVTGALSVHAQTVKINLRPLTPGEIVSYVLTNKTQLAAGIQDVGIGQPAYLEALVTKGTIVTQVTWTLAAKPTGSAAVLQYSPLTNLPSYDSGDRSTFIIAGGTNGRSMLVPDVVGSASKGDYTVVLQVMLTNRTIAVTNTIYGSKYQGMYGEEDFGCELCHSDKIPNFTLTAHSDAFKRKINGEAGAGFRSTCVSCHVLGYDTTAVATNGGFDDVALQVGWIFPTNLALPSATNNWNLMPAALQVKANIQCESCHGPGRRHMLGGGDTNMIGISLSAGNCGQCHDSMTHHVKNYEWAQTLHATGSLHTSSSCLPCHTTPGFIDVNDPGVDFDGSNVVTRGTRNEGITCAACHDPHTKGMGVNQLRNIASVTLSNNVVVTLGGEGLLCMKCHHDRNDANIRVLSTSGPHHGTQGDMLCGTNAVQYGIQMPSSRHLQVVTDSCVTCHMQATPTNGLAMNKVGGHTFMIGWDAGTPDYEGDDVHLTAGCTPCHGVLTNLNFGGEDYDQNGLVEGVQQEIKNMLVQLALLLPPYSGTNIVTSSFTTNAADYNKRAAAYNWNFVKEDSSYGVHNPKYASSILRASIDTLRAGFVDVNYNGVPDTWETAYFGNLTSMTATSDHDGDGLTDIQEYHAGTSPNNQDSDRDLVWDLAELQAGTDPLNPASLPATNQVYILPAVELGYVPQTIGTRQQFQSINKLGTTPPLVWTNMGSSFISSNAWFYQLMSTRDVTQRYFRVIQSP
ncbi:MAG: multiheme c-type cytochrome [bacterium]